MIKPLDQSSASAWPSAAALISCATYTINIAYKKQNASKKFCLFSTTYKKNLFFKCLFLNKTFFVFAIAICVKMLILIV